MVSPAQSSEDWFVEYAWQSKHSGPPTERVPLSKLKKDKLELLIPVETTQKPGIAGKIRLIASEWNVAPEPRARASGVAV